MKRLLLALAMLAGLSVPATAAEQVGRISRMTGTSIGSFGGRAEALALSAAVFLEHRLATGPAARLEVTFADTSLLTMGENAALTIDRFVYDPDRTSRVVLAVTGALRFVGAVKRPPQYEVTIDTPVAAIGARGTEFWAGPIDGQYGILLIEGQVSVTSAAGELVLDKPGDGVNFAAPGAPPSAVTRWPEAKVQRALAAVAFP